FFPVVVPGTDQDHLSVLGPAVQLEQSSVIVDPRLVPVLGHGVIDVQARAAASLRRLPVLLERAAVEDGDDAIVPGGLSGRIDDVPLAQPEVELTVRRSGARSE